MGLKEQYDELKEKLINDDSICDENKKWFKKILEYQEYKLKRKNGLPSLDDGCYKTLLTYIAKCKNVNKWFQNKPGIKYTEKAIKDVYDGLEDRKLVPNGDRKKYYSQFFKSEPFEIIGKKELAKKVIKYTNKVDEEVRFFSNEDFVKIRENIINPGHRTSVQVAWDITENLASIIKTEARDYERKIRKIKTDDGNYIEQAYYNVILRKEILKRARTSRTEPTIYPETTDMLDEILPSLEPNDKVFTFGQRQAEDMFNRACKRAKVKIQPSGNVPYPKDIRSSSACHLLDMGWNCDDIRARMGQKPSSRVLDRYVTYKAKNKERIIDNVHKTSMKDINNELKETKQREQMLITKVGELQNKMDIIMETLMNVAKGETKISMLNPEDL